MLRALPIFLLAALASAQGAITGPCYQPSLGANLALTDDSVAVGLPLGFNFPMPGGGSTPVISVSSNGFVWLGTRADPGCCNGDVAKLITQTARIAPLWLDLDPGAGGAVWFNALPASGGLPASAVVTWDSVPEFGTSAVATFQLQLFADGSFVTFYDSRIATGQLPLAHVALVGVSQGGNAVANNYDISAAAGSPIDTGANPTFYEDFQWQGAFDLQASVWTCVPNGQGGYILAEKAGCSFASVQRFGRGCPQPALVYELFDGLNPLDLANTALEFAPIGGGAYVATPATGFFTGYVNQQVFGDDDVQGPFALPFAFAYPGGSTTAIDISSNGFLWLQGGSNNDPRCCDGDPSRFVYDPASICGLWMDLFPPGAPAAGGIFFDVVGGAEAHITWVDVPEYGLAGSNTFQITLRSNGSFRLSWGNVANFTHACLVGFSGGGSGIDPGPTDLTQGVFATPPAGNPLQLDAQTGSRPLLGGVFTMEIGGIDPAAVLGLLVLGFTQYPDPGIDLGPLGMPGCALYASLDSVQAVPLAGMPTPVALAAPANPALAGVLLQAQAATLTPGATPLGLVASNGLELKFGLY